MEMVKVTHIGQGHNVSRRTTRVLSTNAGKLAVSPAWPAQCLGEDSHLLSGYRKTCPFLCSLRDTALGLQALEGQEAVLWGLQQPVSSSSP